MSTTRKHTATQAGPVTVDIDLTAGAVRVVVEDREYAEVTAVTTDKEGPSAEAVNGMTVSERGDRLVVRVPDPGGTAGGVTQVTNTRGGVTVVQTAGAVYGTVIGAVHGDVVHFGGGGMVISGGRGAIVVGGSPIFVEARLPRGSRLVARTSSADVNTFGLLAGASVTTMSGDVHLEAVGTVDINTMSGDVGVREYAGPGQIKTMSGDITVHAVAETSLRATSMSGSIRTAGKRLALDAQSMSGRVSSS